jgi:hypothetical protein
MSSFMLFSICATYCTLSRGKDILPKVRMQLFITKQSEIREKARENAMFSLAFLGAEERI